MKTQSQKSVSVLDPEEYMKNEDVNIKTSESPGNLEFAINFGEINTKNIDKYIDKDNIIKEVDSSLTSVNCSNYNEIVTSNKFIQFQRQSTYKFPSSFPLLKQMQNVRFIHKTCMKIFTEKTQNNIHQEQMQSMIFPLIKKIFTNLNPKKMKKFCFKNENYSSDSIKEMKISSIMVTFSKISVLSK